MELNVTFIIQLGAFLFAVLMLANVAFGPVLRTLDERHKRIEGARAEAERLLTTSGSQAETIEKRLAEARKEGQDILARLKTEGEKQENDLVGKARGEAQKQIDDARHSLEKATAVVRGDLKKSAQQLAEAIAEKALGRKA